MPARSSTRKIATASGKAAKSDSSVASEILKPRQSGRVTKTVSAKKGTKTTKKSKYVDESEPEAEETDSDEDRAPRRWTQKLPQARAAGNVEYEDNRIHPNTFLFLGDLKANNNRVWLKSHDEDFRTAQKDFESFVGELTALLIEKDPTIPELPPKDIIFRIYRDVRFSKDQTPYKTHFSVAWSRTGRKGPYAAYYLQIAPGDTSFIGGGLWQPDAAGLAVIREDIDQRPRQIKSTLMNKDLRRVYFDKVKGGEKEVVAAFVKGNAEGALKTKPKGFDADHPSLDLLRLRNFTMGKKIPDTDILRKDGIKNIADALGGLVPWVTYLNSVVMPDH